MPRVFYPALGGLALAALSACSTVEQPPPAAALPAVAIVIPTPPPPEPAAPVAPAAAAEPFTPRPHGAAERALHAQGVYLVRPHRIGELEHLMVTEVWRHDPALGPAPVIGAEWMPGNARAPMRGEPELALICVTATPRGQSMTTAIFRGGRLVPEGVTLDTLRRAVEETPPPPMPLREVPRAPSADECIAHADAVYLVRLEPAEDGRLAYFVSEVWRHARPGPAPEIGTRVPDTRVLPPALPGRQSGDMAVMFLFPELRPGEGGRRTTRMTVTIRNGYAWGTLSLIDLHDRVVAATPPPSTTAAE